jgi:uncharacterized membrane protein HdeD (DUF308 family)
MKSNFKQLINGILILIGAVFMAYSFVIEDVSVLPQVIGLILLMIGAYRASMHWSVHKDDHENDSEN